MQSKWKKNESKINRKHLIFLLVYMFGFLFGTISHGLDIGINVFYGVTYDNRSVLLGLLTQIPFGIFVWITARGILKYPSLQDYLSWDFELP